MELEIINKKPIPIFVAATTSAVPLINNNVSAETDGAMVSTEKSTGLLVVNPITSEEIPQSLGLFLFSFIYQ